MMSEFEEKEQSNFRHSEKFCSWIYFGLSVNANMIMRFNKRIIGLSASSHNFTNSKKMCFALVKQFLEIK